MSMAPPSPVSPPAPRVSVVLPAYNREGLVTRAIDSALAQEGVDFELIVVDDASTDGTRAVLQRYGDDPRVRLILSDENMGGGGARNLGIAEARAPLIAFQDSDDLWLPGKLAAQVAALDAEPKAGLCYVASLYSQGRASHYIPEDRFSRLAGDMSREILRSNTSSTQTLMIRREVLDEAGHFDPAFRRFQDWDLMIRIAQITEFVFLPDPMVVIFGTPGNISSDIRNGAIARSALLKKYASLFEAAPRRAWRQHYIAARLWRSFGDSAQARHHLTRAVRLRLARPEPD